MHHNTPPQHNVCSADDTDQYTCSVTNNFAQCTYTRTTTHTQDSQQLQQPISCLGDQNSVTHNRRHNYIHVLPKCAGLRPPCVPVPLYHTRHVHMHTENYCTNDSQPPTQHVHCRFHSVLGFILLSNQIWTTQLAQTARYIVYMTYHLSTLKQSPSVSRA